MGFRVEDMQYIGSVVCSFRNRIQGLCDLRFSRIWSLELRVLGYRVWGKSFERYTKS
jgi:hypothetical protein